MKEPIKPEADRFASPPAADLAVEPVAAAEAPPPPPILPDDTDQAPIPEVLTTHLTPRPTFRPDEEPPDTKSEWAGLAKGLFLVLAIMAVLALVATALQR
ncbi:hypothetical protein IAI18_15195 [Acetobacteraceae bacterium H6797]|nr:hypothetical protein [Acetobacteraceae bacterium H6797]